MKMRTALASIGPAPAQCRRPLGGDRA
jgi:hypothetical protein